MYIKLRCYSYKWLLINIDEEDVNQSEKGLVLPYSNITFEGAQFYPGTIYRVLGLKVKLSTRPVSLSEFGPQPVSNIFLSDNFTGTTECMGLDSMNCKYNIYNGYFDRAYIRIA